MKILLGNSVCSMCQKGVCSLISQVDSGAGIATKTYTYNAICQKNPIFYGFFSRKHSGKETASDKTEIVGIGLKQGVKMGELLSTIIKVSYSKIWADWN
jgi:hypothetical protein